MSRENKRGLSDRDLEQFLDEDLETESLDFDPDSGSESEYEQDIERTSILERSDESDGDSEVEYNDDDATQTGEFFM